MSERMTAVSLPDHHDGFADRGAQHPSVMIDRLRHFARAQMAQAQAVLDAPDEAFLVETYNGVHVRRNLRVLQAPREGAGADAQDR